LPPQPAAPSARAAAQATRRRVGRTTAPHSIRSPVRRLALAGALCSSFVAGCGGDGDEGSRGRTVTVAAGREVRVVGREYSFDPAKVVVARAGAVKLTLVNEGSLAHDLRVLRDGRELGGTPAFQGRTARSATVRLARGRYELVCTVGNHSELGMRGTVEVR
jgi:plastocyanin